MDPSKLLILLSLLGAGSDLLGRSRSRSGGPSGDLGARVSQGQPIRYPELGFETPQEKLGMMNEDEISQLLRAFLGL